MCRRTAFPIIISIAILIFKADAKAWEFSMEATMDYVYQYYSQMGPNGFFGRQDVDGSIGTAGPYGLKPGDYASVNTWVGRQIGRSANDFAAGTDAAKHYQTLEVWPEFRINNAIRFRAKYRLGDYGNPINSEYLTNTRPGVNVATSDGQWTQWWMTTQFPWGQVVFGKRKEAFGTGLQYNGESNNTTEGLALVAPYGPFRISFALRPVWELAPNPGLNAKNYYNILDKNGIRQLSYRYFTTYQSGPLELGVFFAVMRWHAGSESQNIAAKRAAFNPYDLLMNHGTMYMKFFNGRVFFNAEAAFFKEDTHTMRTRPGPLYKNSWRYMVEFGGLAGASKVSFLGAYLPGADRRRGRLINNQPYHNSPPFGMYDLFKPYSYLLGYSYGSGVNAFNINGWGYINEAVVLATRLDHALAANLNVFGTFLWAERSSKGYSWGFVRPGQNPTINQTVNAVGNLQTTANWTPLVKYGQLNGAPNIPDSSLGWEVTAGLNWKLLEHYTLNGVVAYWQPGKWFNYACVDKKIPGWDDQTDATPSYPFGTNPNRTIDPVMAAEVAVAVDF